MKTFSVITAMGQYSCSACGQTLAFEPTKVVESSHAIASCLNGHDCGDPECSVYRRNCKLWKVRLRIPLQRIECEALEPPGEDWPH